MKATAKEAEPPHMAGGVVVGVAAGQRGVCAPILCCQVSRKEPAARKPATVSSQGTNERPRFASVVCVSWWWDSGRRGATQSKRVRHSQKTQLVAGGVISQRQGDNTVHAKRGGVQARQARQDGDWVGVRCMLRSRPRHRGVLLRHQVDFVCAEQA